MMLEQERGFITGDVYTMIHRDTGYTMRAMITKVTGYGIHVMSLGWGAGNWVIYYDHMEVRRGEHEELIWWN